MSLIITTYTKEGIVMASDSRISFPDNNYHFDNAYKTFLCPNNTGISTCGDATINGIPIAGYIETFINTKLSKDTQITDMPDLLLKDFSAYSPKLNTHFQIAGYAEENGNKYQLIYIVHIKDNNIEKILNPSNQGLVYNGEICVLSNLIDSRWVEDIDQNGNKIYVEQNHAIINWNAFSLQDAIDFSVFAINTTKTMQQFEQKHGNVGGPIDILAIKPSGAFWIKRKELHA